MHPYLKGLPRSLLLAAATRTSALHGVPIGMHSEALSPGGGGQCRAVCCMVLTGRARATSSACAAKRPPQLVTQHARYCCLGRQAWPWWGCNQSTAAAAI